MHGTLQMRDDIYGRDARHIAIFRSDERKVGRYRDRPAARPAPASARMQLRYPDTRKPAPSPIGSRRVSRTQQVDRRGNRVVQNRNNAPVGNFFERLFR